MQYKEDSYYIEKIIGGEINAYSFLVQKHKRMAFTLALKMVKNREDAEEIAQDSFVKAFQSIKDFRNKSKFSTWLFRIVYNICISKLRKKKLDFFSKDDDKFCNFDIQETENFLTKLTDKEQTETVRSAIDQLPDDERTLITLFYLNECSVDEIAEITSLSVSNVKVKLFRTRKKLWEKLNHLITENAVC